jgi:hypothetical protein
VLGQAVLELRHGEVASGWDLAHDSLEILASCGDRRARSMRSTCSRRSST